MAGAMAQVVEHLLSKGKVQKSNSSTTKTKKEKLVLWPHM
jgi:hypothetical protein